MKSQLDAWNSRGFLERNTTRAVRFRSMESYQDGYLSESEASAGQKPFLPGYYLLNGTGGYDDPNKSYAVIPEKVAGVDDIGIVQGALSGSGSWALKSITGEDLLTPIDSYYKMDAAAAGLDSDGKPKYGRTSSNNYDDIPNLTAADIEKNTIIVPDVRLVQEGDLLVKTGDQGRLHIGVVVGFKNKPAETAGLSEWMNSILVVSSRAGFRMANLGVWGNGGGMFGGFAEDPENYIIRRWLLPPAGLAEAGLED